MPWEGAWRRVDLGRAGETLFLLMAGVGFDADVAAQVTPPGEAPLGAPGVPGAGAGHRGLRWPRQRMWLLLDGRSMRRRLLFVVVGNTRLYGGVVNITDRAVVDDGLLDVCLFGGQEGAMEKVWHALRVVTRSHTRHPTVEYYRVQRFTLVTRPRVSVQVDGDTIGETPMTFEAVPGALRVVVPQGPSTGSSCGPRRAGGGRGRRCPASAAGAAYRCVREATAGIEPAIELLQSSALTTWPRRQK